MKLPIVDLAKFDPNDLQSSSGVIENVTRACEDNGFFQLINHGVPDQLREEVMNVAHSLFDLTGAEKLDLSLCKSPKNRGRVSKTESEVWD